MDYKQAEKLYKMLANQRRLRIIKYLNRQSKASVRQIAKEINLSFKATSKHLQLLKNAGLIESEQVNLNQYYFLENKKDVFIKHALSIL